MNRLKVAQVNTTLLLPSNQSTIHNKLNNNNNNTNGERETEKGLKRHHHPLQRLQGEKHTEEAPPEAVNVALLLLPLPLPHPATLLFPNHHDLLLRFLRPPATEQPKAEIESKKKEGREESAKLAPPGRVNKKKKKSNRRGGGWRVGRGKTSSGGGGGGGEAMEAKCLAAMRGEEENRKQASKEREREGFGGERGEGSVSTGKVEISRRA